MAAIASALEAHTLPVDTIIGPGKNQTALRTLLASKSSSSSTAGSMADTTATSYTSIAVGGGSKSEAAETRRPSIISRIKSSMSTYSTVSAIPLPQSVAPADFLTVPGGPEKRFIDSIGMVIPGVSDRKQCTHAVAHFVVDWRLCAPIEYTTGLADHGITYSDYCLLMVALANFCERIVSEQKPVSSYAVESPEQYRKTELQARSLNELLEEITTNLRLRCVPVMVCVESFALFAPHRITEAQIQILHVPVGSQCVRQSAVDRFGFIDPFTGESKPTESTGETSVSIPHRKLSDPFTSPYIRNQGMPRDRSKPLPLWPNAIPTSKRELIDTHVGRYAVDPYFREYMRANVDSRANPTSYAKYMIEREDNPFINTRLDYADSPSRTQLLLKYLTANRYKTNDRLNTNAVNRARYEHNRRLECRKTVELGSRLRIVRFGFRHPLLPPHTPEMTELGLGQEKYEEITSHIISLRQYENSLECGARFLSFGAHRSIEDSLVRVSEYLRELNASQLRIIWTIERVPGVYDGFLRSGKEWEISAWNAEDPLELLLQLEKWGVIEKKLDFEEDE